METLDVSDDVLTASVFLLGELGSEASAALVVLQLPAAQLVQTQAAGQPRFGFGGENAAAVEIVRERLRDLLGTAWERILVVEEAAGYVGAVRLRPAVHRVEIAPGGVVKVGG